MKKKHNRALFFAITALSVSSLLTGCKPPAVIVLRSNEILVKKGDNIYEIAYRHNIPLRELVRANALRAPYELNQNQKLIIPRESFEDPSVPRPTDQSKLQSPSLPSGPVALHKGDINNAPEEDAEDPKETPESADPAEQMHTPEEEDEWSSVTETPAREGDKSGNRDGGKLFDAPQHPGGEAADSLKEAVDRTAEMTAQIPETPSGEKESVSGLIIRPVPGSIVTRFGDSDCLGLYFKATDGEAIRSPADGVVRHIVELNPTAGVIVFINHPSGLCSITGPYRSVCVKSNQTVTKGQTLGTFNSAKGGDKMYLEVRKDRTAIDPEPLLRGGSAASAGGGAKENSKVKAKRSSSQNNASKKSRPSKAPPKKKRPVEHV